jgi:Uma2 family endonuclease
MVMLGSEPLGLHFPVDAEVPETTWHLRLRTLVYLFLKHAFEDVASIGSEQFVYWDPTNPRACLAPDAFVRFGGKNEDFGCWKAWERGAPHVAVEIISDSDASDADWQEKLERYRRLGVSELVRFDYQTPEQPLRIWDFVGDDLLERRLFEPWAQSRHLGGYWRPVEADNGDLSLRLSHDEQGLRLFPTPEEHFARERGFEIERRQLAERALQRESEARQRESEARQRESEARQRESEALRAAERRIAELEAELRRRS